ncbi:MAG: transcription termination factor Rho [Actinomycetales bacterium]
MTDTIDAARQGALTTLKLPELQAIASQMGLKGVGRMRKGDLIEAIRAGRSGSASAPTSATTSAPAPTSASTSAAPAASQDEPAPAAEAPASDAAADQGQPPRRSRRATSSASAPSTSDAPTGGDQLPDLGIQLPSRSDDAGRPEQSARQNQGRADGARRQGGNNQDNARQGNSSQQGGGNQGGSARQSGSADLTLDDLGEAASRRRDGGQGNAHQGGGQGDDDGQGGGRRRRGRDRNRNRDRRRGNRGGQGPGDGAEEIEVSEDDVLLPVAGIVDILDQYAFVRTSGYLPGSSDVYVTLNQVRKFGLRRGDAVTGAVRQGDDNQQSVQNHGGGGGRGRQNNQRQKFNPLVRLDTVNGMTVERARQRPEFGKLTPLYPQDQLRLETTPKAITPRVIDLVSPVGKGQRGLIVSPPKAGKTIIMQQIANAIAVNNPDVHLMVVLVDERPEEVTDMQRLVKGEVIASTFDRPASDHTVVAELAIERAKRLVELGQDVVVLLDSLTRLSRAYNLAAPASGRILSGGVDASALYPPKKFFGAARNIENGGSLTILASALVETGSKMDEVIFEEFKGTGNMELRLSRQLADKRIFPAVDVNASGTRREELLMSSEELKIMWKLRRVMGALDLQQASDLLLGKLRETHSNAEFLMTVQKNTPTTPNNPDPDYAIQ